MPWYVYVPLCGLQLIINDLFMCPLGPFQRLMIKNQFELNYMYILVSFPTELGLILILH